MKDYLKYIFPVVLVITGVALFVIGAKLEQNNLFMIGAGAILGVGVVAFLNALGIINNALKYVFTLILGAAAAYLFYLDYRSIKSPLEFMEERERRYKYVIESLKDIRRAELAYKSKKGMYTNDFDSLMKFIKTDSLIVVKANGTVPDTLTEEKAFELGLISRDSSKVAVVDTIFSKFYIKSRAVSKFDIDSIRYIPFSGGKEFWLDAGLVEKGNVKVPVFEVVATKEYVLRGLNNPQLIKQSKELKVGSMLEPSTSGNWE